VYSGLNGFVKKWEKAVNITELFSLYYISKYYEHGYAKNSSININDIVSVLERTEFKSKSVYRMDDTISQKKIDYIHSVIQRDFYLMKRSKLSLRLFRKYFAMKQIPKNKWREFIVDYLTATEEFFVKRTHKYEDIKIPYEWFLSTKPSDNKVSIENPFGVTNLDVIVNYFTQTGSQSEKHVSTIRQLVARRDSEFNRVPTIVLHQQSCNGATKSFIKHLFNLGNSHNVRVMYTSITNVGLLSTLDGFYSMDQLKTNSSHVLGAIATTFLIQRSFKIAMIDVRNSNSVSDVAFEFEKLVPEWKNRFESLRAFLNKHKDYYDRFRNDPNDHQFGKYGTIILLSLVEAAITNHTLNYTHIETTEFLCELTNRYGKSIANKKLDVHDLVALDIASRRKRILPIKYYAEFYRMHNRQKKNPTTCNVLGLGASLIHKHLITTT
jgi:hypothetical protein